jgi:hypothetical protein
LEKTVQLMQEEHTRVRLEQEKVNKAHQEIELEMNRAIIQLQQDILDQNDVNHSQQAAISHLEVVVADLVARVAKAEDRENVPDLANQRSNRSTEGHPVI